MHTPRESTDMQARPAEALLASRMMRGEEVESLIAGVCGGGADGARTQQTETEVLGTGVESVDEVFAGGLEGARVVSLGAEPGAGGSELCQMWLVSALFTHGDSTAAVVDTTGNFDILRLYTFILAKLQRDARLLESMRLLSGVEESPEDVAARLLDRVKIMRVFDFVGVREAVGEIRDELEDRTGTAPTREVTVSEPEVAKEIQTVVTPPKRTMVADSEDEGEDDDDDDEDMLFDLQPIPDEPIPAPQLHASEPPHPSTAQPIPPAMDNSDDGSSTHGKVKFILIDNLAHVLSPMLKKDYVSTTALASTFLHSLHNLTATHTLHTLLTNPTTTPRVSSPARQSATTANQRHGPPPAPSIFASSTAVPSLTNLLARYVDMCVLVTRVPKRRMDAKVHYSDAGGAGSSGGKKRGVELVSVVEVLSDRWERRVGAWGAFVVGKEGLKSLD
ncbi:hypothetical protein ACN47E_008771 [Coniothyrium glycines]